MCATRKRAASLDGVGSPNRGKLANPAISKKRCFQHNTRYVCKKIRVDSCLQPYHSGRNVRLEM